MALESLFETPPSLVNSNNETLTMSAKSVFERGDDGDDDAEEGEILEDGELPESDGEGGEEESIPDNPDTQPVEGDISSSVAHPGSEGEGDGDQDYSLGWSGGKPARVQGSYDDPEEEQDAEVVEEHHHRSSSHRKKRKKKHRRERAKRRRRHRSGSGDEDITPPGSPNPQEDFLDRSYPPRRSLSRYDSPPAYDSPPEGEFGAPQRNRERSQGYFVPSDYWEEDEEEEAGLRGRRKKNVSQKYEDDSADEDRYNSDEGDDQYPGLLSQSENSGLGRGTGHFKMQSQRGRGKGRGKGRGASGRGASGRGGAHHASKAGPEDAEDAAEESGGPGRLGRGGGRGRGTRGKGGKGRGKAMGDQGQHSKLRPICKFYLEGKCTKGTACTFSHAILPNKKMEQCKFYIQGQCQKGEDCLYIHGEMPCKYYHTGAVCYQGENCKFSHEPLNENTRLLLGKVLKGGLQDVMGPEIQRQPHQTRGLLPHPTGPPQLPNPSSKKIPSIFEIKTQLVGEDGRRIAELEEKRVMDQSQMLNFYGSGPSRFEDAQEVPSGQDQQSRSKPESFSLESDGQGFQDSPDSTERPDFQDPEAASTANVPHQQPAQRDNTAQEQPPQDSERAQKPPVLHQQGHERLDEKPAELVEPDYSVQQQQPQQAPLPQQLKRLNQKPQVSPQHQQRSPQHSQGSTGRLQLHVYQQRTAESSLRAHRPVAGPSEDYDHGDIDMRMPRTKHNSETEGLIIDDPAVSTESSECQDDGRLQDIDERFPRKDSIKENLEDGEDSSVFLASIAADPVTEEKKPDITSVTQNMPAKQRALFMRIQQKQAESSEEGEEEERRKEDVKKSEDVGTDKDASRDDDNWYSSDEEEGGGDSANSIASVIKNVREKSDTLSATDVPEKPQASVPTPSSQPAPGQLLPNALASLFSAKAPTVGQPSDPSVLAQQNALSSILGLVGKSVPTTQPKLPNLLITVKQTSEQPAFPDAGGDSLALSRKVAEFVLLEVTYNEKLKDPRADREKKDKSDLRLRKLLWKDNEYTINDTQSRPTLAPIELLTPTELKSQPDFSGSQATAAVTPPVQAQAEPRSVRPADPRIQRPRDPRTPSSDNNQGNSSEPASQQPRDPRLANRDPRLNAGAVANQNQEQENVEKPRQGGLLPTPKGGMQPPGMMGFPPGGPFGPQGPPPQGMPPQNPNFPPFPNGRFPVRFPPGGGPPGNMNQAPRFPPRGPLGHPMRNPRPRFPPPQGMPFRGPRFGDAPNRMPMPNRPPGPNRGPPQNMGPQLFGGPGPNVGPPMRGPLMRGLPPMRGAPPRGQGPMRGPAPRGQGPSSSNPPNEESSPHGPQFNKKASSSQLQEFDTGNSGGGDASSSQSPTQLGSSPRQETVPKPEPADAKQASTRVSDPRLARQMSLPKASDHKLPSEGNTLIRQNSAPATSPRPEDKEGRQFPRDDSTPMSPPATTKQAINPKEPPLILRIKLRGENDKPEITSSVSDSGSDSDLPARRSRRTKGSGSDSDHFGGLPESRKRPPDRKSGLAGFSIPKIPKKSADKSEADSSSSEDGSKSTASSGSIEHRQVPSAHHRLPQVTSSFNQSAPRPTLNPNQGTPAVRTSKSDSSSGLQVSGGVPAVNPAKVEPGSTDPSKQGNLPLDDISLKDMFNIKDPTASPFC